jgi:hypothetical protein
MMKTRLARVPCEFWDEVDKISSSRRLSKTEFLRTDGVRILRNSRTLTDMIFGRGGK